MKKAFIVLCGVLIFLCGCAVNVPEAQVAATTLPVYDFATQICEGTPITVTRLITEQVSCLHDYSLNVRQVKAVEAADIVIVSGAGLEDFMENILKGKITVDASAGIDLLCAEASHEEEGHEHGHHHESDPHIWLDPNHASVMAENICLGLSAQYPEYAPVFEKNCGKLQESLAELYSYGTQQLQTLRCREMITFHDGFHYFADAFDLTILEAVEEESGSEASAQELIHLIDLVRERELPAVFTEKSGSVSAASVLSRETGCRSLALDMGMADGNYFEAMYHNIDAVKEALQ